MKRYSPIQKSIAFACSCVFIFILTSQHADAARRSRVLSIALFASGMSLQLGGNFLKASAQNHYDSYLNTAIQADIQTHKDAFLARKNASTIVSRVGFGCIGLAVLFSIYSQVVTPELVDESVSSARSLHPQIGLQWTRSGSFAKRLSRDPGLLFPRTAFQVRPHYDFQTRSAGLSLLHLF